MQVPEDLQKTRVEKRNLPTADPFLLFLLFLLKQMLLINSCINQAPDSIHNCLLILLISNPEPFIRCVKHLNPCFSGLYQLIDHRRKQIFRLQVSLLDLV